MSSPALVESAEWRVSAALERRERSLGRETERREEEGGREGWQQPIYCQYRERGERRESEGAREADGGRERARQGGSGALPNRFRGGGGAVGMAEGAPVPAETDPLLHEPDCPAGFKPDGEDSDNVAKFKSIIVTPAGEGLDGALRVSTRRHC